METQQTWFVIGIVLATISTISGILAFALPSWIYTYDRDSTIGIDMAGLWTFCLDTYFDPRYNYNNGVPMYGCHWIYSSYLEDIRWTILNPNWYIVVQIMASVNLILSLLGVGGLYIICFVRRNNCPLVFGIISMFFCTIIGFCEVVLYGLRVTDDEYYKVPNIRFKKLGAGWGMAIVSAIMSGLALVALVISYMTVRTERRNMKRALGGQGETQQFRGEY